MLVENVKNQIYSTGNLYLECLGKWQVYGNQISNVIAVHYRTQCTQQSQNNASSPETLEPWGGNVTCCAALKTKFAYWIIFTNCKYNFYSFDTTSLHFKILNHCLQNPCVHFSLIFYHQQNYEYLQLKYCKCVHTFLSKLITLKFKPKLIAVN